MLTLFKIEHLHIFWIEGDYVIEKTHFSLLKINN